MSTDDAALTAIIFDFDLTLADSTAAFLDCHRFAAARFGLPLPDREHVLSTIGTPLPRAFPMLYGADHTAVRDDYIRVYQARADEVMTGMTSVLAGVPAALRALHAAGVPLAIVSQKLRYRIEDVLGRDGLRDLFGALVGGADVPDLKPDPRGLLKAAAGLGVAADQALYVGDTVIDAEAAANAGMRFVAVLSGVTPADRFAAYAPLAILDDVSGLPDLWRDLSRGDGST